MGLVFSNWKLKKVKYPAILLILTFFLFSLFSQSYSFNGKIEVEAIDSSGDELEINMGDKEKEEIFKKLNQTLIEENYTETISNYNKGREAELKLIFTEEVYLDLKNRIYYLKTSHSIENEEKAMLSAIHLDKDLYMWNSEMPKFKLYKDSSFINRIIKEAEARKGNYSSLPMLKAYKVGDKYVFRSRKEEKFSLFDLKGILPNHKLFHLDKSYFYKGEYGVPIDVEIILDEEKRLEKLEILAYAGWSPDLLMARKIVSFSYGENNEILDKINEVKKEAEE